MSKPKLIIHEIDGHGSGNIYFNGKEDNYAYDDGSWGDVQCTVRELIKIGFINADDVVFFTEADEESIYKYVERGLSVK